MKRLLEKAGLVMLAMGLLIACSSDDDKKYVINDDEINNDEKYNDNPPIISCPGAIEYVKGGDVYDWAYQDDDKLDPLELFFNEELHSPYWDDYGNVHKSFFEQGSWDDESCLMINTREDFQNAYMGTKELPEVDFDKYTLVIGRTWGNDGSYKLVDVMLIDNDDDYLLESYLVNHNGMATLAIVRIYYWRLYPKLPQKDIVIKRIVVDENNN